MMDGAACLTASFGPDALSRLMPMHVLVSASGHIRSVGPTLAKLATGQDLAGQRFLEVFLLRRPGDVATVDGLLRHGGERLQMVLRARPQTAFRGIAAPLADGGGLLINLSFGIAVADAVRDHGLTNADFAPTDLTIELLYLAEVKTAITAELHDLNSRLQGAKTRAEEHALTDTLTGLRNRRAMDLALEKLIAANLPFGLMHIDLDFFKQVNDTLGHAAGDHVLQCVAAVMQRETRKSDQVARVGGDEFVVLFPGLVDTGRLELIAHRIIARLQVPIDFQGEECRIAASIGINTTAGYDMPDAEQLLADADTALYQSKRAGRGRATVFVPDNSPEMKTAG
ncbi:MAG: diguanylate cyclase [Paracoccaceae bacterium]